MFRNKAPCFMYTIYRMNYVLEIIVHEGEASAYIPQGPYNLFSLQKLAYLLYLIQISGSPSLSMIIKQDVVFLHNLPGNNICFLLKPEITLVLCMFYFLDVAVVSSQDLNLTFIFVFSSAVSNSDLLV